MHAHTYYALTHTHARAFARTLRSLTRTHACARARAHTGRQAVLTATLRVRAAPAPNGRQQ